MKEQLLNVVTNYVFLPNLQNINEASVDLSRFSGVALFNALFNIEQNVQVSDTTKLYIYTSAGHKKIIARK